MYSTYASSAIAFRSKGSIPFSSNDGCYYLLNERVNKSASNSSCACCTFCFHGVPINPRFLYGLRQSTLLHYSASRMLILGAGHRNYRFLVSDFNRSCCGDGYFIKESVGTSRRRRRGRCMAWEDKKCDLGVDGTAEAMLGLLAEQVDEKVLGVRKRNGRSVSEKARVEGRRRGRAEKKNLELDSLEMNSEIKFESVTNVLREEGHRRLGDKEVSSGHESSKLRKEGSSCSSYYSILSSDDIDESDVDIQDKDGEFIGGSSSKHQNKEMRSGEVVFEGNVRKKFEKYEDHAAEYWESLTHENDEEEYSMAIGVAQDVRNRGGKQYTEDSVGEKESRKEFLLKPSNTMDSHGSVAERVSASRKQVRSREKKSTLSTPLVEKIGQKHSQSGVQVIQQSVSRRKSQQTETPEIQESDIGTSSSSQLRFSGREENLSATGTVVQEAREKHNRKGNLIIRENRPSLNSQSETKTLVHDIDLERTSHSQRTSVSRLNNAVDNSAMLLTSVHDSREQRTLTDQKFVGKTETREESQDLTNISVSHSTDTKTVADSKEVLETRMTSRKEKSTSIVDLAQEARGHQATEGVIRRVGSRNSQRPTTERDSSSRTPFNYLEQARQQHVAAQSEDGRNSQVMVMPPPSQFVARTSHETIGYQKSTSGHARENVSFETSGSGSITLQAEDEEPDFPHELEGQMIYGDHSESTLHNDALDSVTRLEESSNQFVGEFAEKLQHEVMTCGLVEEKTTSQKSVVYKNGKYSQHNSSQQVSEDLHSQVHFPGQSSAVSGTKGPSDEMWDVAGPVPQEPSEEHGEVSPTSGIAVVKRSNRSLWSFIADIVRMRWHTRSDTHGLTVKSVGKNSSNESFTSDAWFSSHEPDDKIDENVKKGRRGMKKEDRPGDQFHLGEASSQSQGKATTGTYSQIESDMSSPLGTVESSSPFEGGASLASQDEHFGDKQEVMRSEGLHSTIITADSSLPVHPRHLIRSPPVKEDTSQSSTAKVSLTSKDFGGKQQVIKSDGLHSTIITTDPSLPLHSGHLIRSPPVKEEISESSKAKVSSTNFTEVAEQPILDRLKDDSVAESKDGELKRRKLQRNKQVLTETFEEWEEAYRLESEQRKIDEIFMREALLEARKAADTWEVPVGAVLVQHGKIIARGCNLVEELRDSTAHAEMICIRKASNVLRSWRLADTTLYVTLEPCAMCAGAILQARIDSVVWGAPNKLLGADGSWVRLFPGGPEGASDLTNQLRGPVHPFHPKMAIRRGILANECAEVMQQFFQLRRKKRVASPPPSGLPVSTHPSKLFSKIHDIFSIMFCL